MKKLHLLLSLNRKKISMIVLRMIKRFYHRFGVPGAETKRLVFVLGCQRSGTTMLMKSFERDLRTKSYGQYGLSNENIGTNYLVYPDANGPRLKPYDEIKQLVAREKATLLIVKPLRESQHAPELLNHFSESKAVWIYRHYKDVANSHLAKWGNGVGIRKLRPISDGDTGLHHWSSEKVSSNTREIIRRYFSDEMLSADAAALYWYTRNILYFDLKLYENPDVFLCKYEDIVAEPDPMMRRIYRFLEYTYPGDRIIEHIHSRSLRRGKNVVISTKIEQLCEDLMQRLDQARALHSTAYALDNERLQV